MEKEKGLREAGENYLEAILQLEDESRNVRSVDVANMLGVSRPSVNKAMGVLKQAGMVDQQPYGRIRLTEQGRKRGVEVTNRHQTLKLFLINVLGVDPVIADEDACRMEHVVSEETMGRLADYILEIKQTAVKTENK